MDQPPAATGPAATGGAATGEAGGRFVTVQSRNLSLWQAAVEQAVRQSGPGDAPRAQLLGNPLVRAATAHAVAHRESHHFWNAAAERLREASEQEILRHLSKHTFEQAQAAVDAGGPWEKVEDAIRRGMQTLEAQLLARLGARRFGRIDPLWVECALIYARYWAESGGSLTYRDWTVEGKGDPGYAVVGWRLPIPATVAVIGDWGTGMGDAEALLDQVMDQHRPDAVVHLGDVYYAGTRDECQANFIDVFARAFTKAGRRVPVFTIPGNHDYYDGGVGFYALIDALNASEASWRQQASYFCLRSADDRWQWLGMDTGQGDANPMHLNPAPALRDSEVRWLLDKVDGFPGKTILLSHHQVFSAHSTLDASSAKPYLNAALLGPFADRLGRVPVWFWGHEHNLVLYADGLEGVSRGRLVGSSAFQESLGEDPYAVVHPEVTMQPFDGAPVLAGKIGDFYNHSYAIVTLPAPGGSASASYYQFPSWGEATAVPLPPGQKALLATEDLGSSP
ncbi:MAG TPA: metallophosphoesterase [Actinomycetota bacterium]|nr:metallophosphoesterase [Actinomycetota bacterium]